MGALRVDNGLLDGIVWLKEIKRKSYAFNSAENAAHAGHCGGDDGIAREEITKVESAVEDSEEHLCTMCFQAPFHENAV